MQFLKTYAFNFSSMDNSEFMRNGDFLPTRLQAQQDAVGLITQSKLRSNPESNVGLMTLSGLEGEDLSNLLLLFFQYLYVKSIVKQQILLNFQYWSH